MPDEEVIVPEAEVEIEAVEEEEDAPAEETVEELRARLAKAEEYGNNQKTRAEKAEKKAKEAPPVASTDGKMSLADSHALLKADVHEDDIDRVEKFAKSEGISIKDALKNDELKAILAVRGEKRTTANAANISNVRRGPSKISDEALVDNASKGKLPDSDDEIDRLIAAKAKKK